MKYFFVSLLFILYGCAGNNQKKTANSNVPAHTETEYGVDPAQPYYQQHAGVTLATSQATYSLKNNDKLKYSIYNSDNYWALEREFTINYWHEEAWINYAFDDTKRQVARIIKKDSTAIFTHHFLTDDRYPIPAGKYRIVQGIAIIPNEGDKEQDFELYTEFTVVE